MSDIDSTPAVVLRTVDYSDKDVIVTLFGEETGKLGAIAKNARASKRRFGGGLQPMRLLRVHLARRPNRDLARLDEIDVIEDFPDIEADFDKITAAAYATELLRELTVELDPDPGLFHLIVRFFRGLSDVHRPIAIEAFIHQYEYQVLMRHGSPPAISSCLRCGTPADQFDKVRALRSGEGIVCSDCIRTGEQTGVLADPTIQLLNFFAGHRQTRPDTARDPQVVAQARRFMTCAIQKSLDQPLKSRSSLQTLFDSVDSG
jgi:DNA repair protein RecO (recombination protein O)